MQWSGSEILILFRQTSGLTGDVPHLSSRWQPIGSSRRVVAQTPASVPCHSLWPSQGFERKSTSRNFLTGRFDTFHLGSPLESCESAPFSRESLRSSWPWAGMCSLAFCLTAMLPTCFYSLLFFKLVVISLLLNFPTSSLAPSCSVVATSVPSEVISYVDFSLFFFLNVLSC